MAITWNMGGSDKELFGSQQQLEDFLPDIEDFDLVFLSGQECSVGKMNRRIQRLEMFLNEKGFENIDSQNSFVYMFQMFLVVFIKKSYKGDVSRVNSTYIAKGKNVLVTTVGNKGGLCYSFALRNNVFNIIGCHLQHNLEKQEKRNLMSRELVAEMKMLELQNQIPGLDADQVSDYCFYLGDLNYRLKTTFTDLNNSNVQESAIAMIPTHDQMIEAIKEGYYPLYKESDIDFQPTYKMSATENIYIDKKDQAPSYCDRVIFKANRPGAHNVDFYRSKHNVFGSDHRPV